MYKTLLSLLLLCHLGAAGKGYGQFKEGLVAYYPFTGNADDISGNGNDGKVMGATLTSDRFGNKESAFSFAGTNEAEHYIDLESLLETEIDIDKGDYTICAWVYFKGGTADPRIIGYGWDDGVEMLVSKDWRGDRNKYKFAMNYRWRRLYSGSYVEKNRWYFVVCLKNILIYFRLF